MVFHFKKCAYLRAIIAIAFLQILFKAIPVISLTPGEFVLPQTPQGIICNIEIANFCNATKCLEIYESVILDNQAQVAVWTLRSYNFSRQQESLRLHECIINILVGSDLTTLTQQEDLDIIKYLKSSKFLFLEQE